MSLETQRRHRRYLGRALGAAALCLALSLPSLAVDTGGGGGSGGGGSQSSSSGSGGGSGSDSSGPTLADVRVMIKSERWDAAIRTLKTIVANSPNNADALNLLGYSLRKTGDHDNALGFYLKALKINPRHKGANEYLGELYMETGQLAKAQAQLEVLAKLCGNTTCEEYRDLAEAIGG
jgi:tetratricopeptide (TPR) repeat protein